MDILFRNSLHPALYLVAGSIGCCPCVVVWAKINVKYKILVLNLRSCKMSVILPECRYFLFWDQILSPVEEKQRCNQIPLHWYGSSQPLVMIVFYSLTNLLHDYGSICQQKVVILTKWHGDGGDICLIAMFYGRRQETDGVNQTNPQSYKVDLYMLQTATKWSSRFLKMVTQ